MSLEHLWAGWRAEYVASVSGEAEPHPGGSDAPEACVFCRILASSESDEERHLVYAGERTVVLLNAYPYASGHLLVLPLRHVGDLSALGPEEAAELFDTARLAVQALQSAYQPDGLNLGANLGKAAGAGIPDHLHLHVVPRWHGDTNFMTTVAGTRVLPEALETSWSKVRAAWPS